MPTRQAEHDWIATLKVLQFDSPTLAQFRREAVRPDILDRDPITGRPLTPPPLHGFYTIFV